LKNSKKASKSSNKASRTITRLAAIKTTGREAESKLTVVKSKLAPHEVPPLNLALHTGETFEILDEEIAADTDKRSREDNVVVVRAEVPVSGSLTNG
jgi:hypothetical protein